jgi:uncharacterized membrane protein YqjE
MTVTPARSLEVQREEFARRRMVAMPLAGMLAWATVGLAAPLLDTHHASLVLFIATGCIFYLGVFVSRFTGEHLLSKRHPKNEFDRLFMAGVAMALAVYAIAIPFYLVQPDSLPLTVGILSGLMWLPLSWILRHPVGWMHAGVRTLGVLAAWLAFPEARFEAVAMVIVAVYAVTLVVLERRWRQQQAAAVSALPAAA